MLLQVALCHSFLWLSSIPLCIYNGIQSSVDGHLGCFHVLAIVNSAAMNMRVHVSLFYIVFGLDICPRVGLRGHMEVLWIDFSGISKLFSIVAVPVYIPTTVQEGSK